VKEKRARKYYEAKYNISPTSNNVKQYYETYVARAYLLVDISSPVVSPGHPRPAPNN
jgi:hypothetical protein